MAKKRELQNLTSSGSGENTRYFAGGVEVKVKCIGRGYAIRNDSRSVDEEFFRYVPKEARYFRVVVMADRNRIYVLDYFAPERGKKSK